MLQSYYHTHNIHQPHQTYFKHCYHAVKDMEMELHQNKSNTKHVAWKALLGCKLVRLRRFLNKMKLCWISVNTGVVENGT